MNQFKERLNYLIFGLLIAAVFVIVINSYQINKIAGENKAVPITGDFIAVNTGVDIIPTGVPEVYGAELGISFDAVKPDDPFKADDTIRKLANLDNGITISGKDKERYVTILYRMENGISCEYCCGARAVIFENGEPACGCAHSYAMRGLAKYLITKHGGKYSDEEILEEVAKWKTLFFPAQIQQKASILQNKGIELNYINLASNKYRGIEKGSGGSGMVGGC